MSRFFLLLAVGLLITLLYRRFRAYKGQAKLRNKHAITQNIVRCDYCGLHVPEHENVNDEGRNYCCLKHKALDQTRHPSRGHGPPR